jgi:hypothetical protein
MHNHSHEVPSHIEGIEAIGNLYAFINGERDLDPASAKVLDRGIVALVRRGDSLDAALGLSAAGRRSMQTRLLHMRRDEQLMQAVATVSPDPSLSTWARCLELAPLLRTFVEREWPAVRTQADPRADWPAWKAHLFRARQQDLALPRSPRGLYDVVQRAQGYSTQKPGAKLLSQLL